jgi:hypothetical protein
VSAARPPEHVQRAADAADLGAYIQGFRFRPAVVTPLLVVVCGVVVARSPGFGWSLTLWILGSLMLLWFVLDTIHLIVRHDGVYIYEKGLIDARGVLGAQLTRKVPWHSVRSINYRRQLYLVNLIPYLRSEYCEIHYLGELVPGQPKETSFRLPGRTTDLRHAVELISTHTNRV